MLTMRACTSLACLILATCGSSSSPTTPDAPTADAAPATVRAVTCPPGDMPMVMTSDNAFAYDPMTTMISAHGIVKFVMSPTHDVGPNPIRPSDPGLRVDFGKMACLEFDQAGTFSFLCTAHGFVGTIIVQ
jgi:plastocyanin